jgi:PBSX family phage portal protein
MDGVERKGIAEVRVLETEGRRDVLPSRQFEDVEWDDLGDEIIDPPYPYSNMQKCIEYSWMLMTCIRARALNTVGHGYSFTIREDVDEDEDSADAKAELERLQEVFDAGEELDFASIMQRVVEDMDAFGTGYLEVRPTKGGDPVGAFSHIPAHTARIWVDDDKRPRGLVQIRAGERRYFLPFGSTEKVSYQTGEPTTKAAERATYFLLFRHYSPSSSYYGIPPWIANTADVLGGRSASEYNMRFFENNAVPEMAIVRKNIAMDPESERRLQETLRREHRGARKAHRLAVIDITSGPGTPSGVEQDVRFEKLATISERDMGFANYSARVDDVIRGAFRLPPILVGQVADVNRATAEASIDLAESQVFAPLRRRIEHVINARILGAMGIQLWKLAFSGMSIAKPTDRAKVVAAKKEALSVNDIRREEGLAVIDHELADVPLALLNHVAAEQQAATERQQAEEARAKGRELARRGKRRPFGR